MNRFALVSVLFAALAIVGIWMAGIGSPAFFAIIAGHKALVQVKQGNERGANVARFALVVAYAVVAYVVFAALRGL